jgi:hypothetical protein
MQSADSTPTLALIFQENAGVGLSVFVSADQLRPA